MYGKVLKHFRARLSSLPALFPGITYKSTYHNFIRYRPSNIDRYLTLLKWLGEDILCGRRLQMGLRQDFGERV